MTDYFFELYICLFKFFTELILCPMTARQRSNSYDNLEAGLKKLTKNILVVLKLKAALVPLNYFQLFGNILGKITFYSVATFLYTLACFEILKRYEMVHANDISRRYGFFSMTNIFRAFTKDTFCFSLCRIYTKARNFTFFFI